MPYIKIEMLAGRTKDQKAALAQAITDAMVQHADAKRESVWVAFVDLAHEDFAIGGTLLAPPKQSP